MPPAPTLGTGSPDAALPGHVIRRVQESVIVRAIWNDIVVAESDDTVVVEGNHYFPAAAVDHEVLRPSSTQTVCPWKGTASYWSLEVGAATTSDAAWYYPEPKEAAEQIRGRVAFWKDVTVEP
ncbi:MAG: DUF427 domain-containing protein [Dermatophilaceae bacterium]